MAKKSAPYKKGEVINDGVNYLIGVLEWGLTELKWIWPRLTKKISKRLQSRKLSFGARQQRGCFLLSRLLWCQRRDATTGFEPGTNSSTGPMTFFQPNASENRPFEDDKNYRLVLVLKKIISWFLTFIFFFASDLFRSFLCLANTQKYWKKDIRPVEHTISHPTVPPPLSPPPFPSPGAGQFSTLMW